MTGVWNAIRSADLNSCRCVGDRTYLVNLLAIGILKEDRWYSPSRSVVLEVLALPLQHAASHFNGRWVILSRIHNVRELSQRESWVNHLIVIPGELVPLMILRHSQRAFLQLFCRVVVFISLAAQDAS
jgi:hypothetical protein